MRAKEFIIEYDRGTTLKSWEQKLTARTSNSEESIDQLMDQLESADPTRNKMYTQWIVKRYVAGDFELDELLQLHYDLSDYDSVKKVLTTGKDINQLTYPRLQEVVKIGKERKSVAKFEVIPDTEVLYNGSDGQLAVPKTEEASRALGRGTAWCTAYTDRDTMFDQYNSSGKLYTWRAKNGDKFQFYWGDNIQFMNSSNQPLSPNDMLFFRSINPPTKKLFDKYEDLFLKTGNDSRILKLFNVLSNSQTVWEKALAVDAVAVAAAYQYAKSINGRYPAGEAVIATSAEYSYEYAVFLGKPFLAGEAIIATDPEYSTKYAAFLGNPFPAGEKAIATNYNASYEYAKQVLKGPFPAGEAAIATSAYASYCYAKLLGKPFSAGEAAIADDAYYSYEYAELLDKPFPAGEKAIATSSELSMKYANIILNRKRFPAGEKAIATDGRNSYFYATNILNKRFPAGEGEISNTRYARLYNERFGTNLEV